MQRGNGKKRLSSFMLNVIVNRNIIHVNRYGYVHNIIYTTTNSKNNQHVTKDDVDNHSRVVIDRNKNTTFSESSDSITDPCCIPAKGDKQSAYPKPMLRTT